MYVYACVCDPVLSSQIDFKFLNLEDIKSKSKILSPYFSVVIEYTINFVVPFSAGKVSGSKVPKRASQARITEHFNIESLKSPCH